jgi:two-component system nitrate/nitrite response regulator NarL
MGLATDHTTNVIGVVVVDDSRVFLDSICFALNRRREIRVLGAARSGAEGVHLVLSSGADVAVVDLRMPGMSGVELTRALREHAPHVPVIALTVSPDEEDLSEALRAGACSYVLKPNAREELPLAIKAAARGESWLTPSMTRKLISSYTRSPSAVVRDSIDTHEELTSRERSVLAYLAQGRTNREIGEKLYIAETTVKTHLKNIFAKLDVRNRAEAAAFAWRLGLVENGGS